MSDTKIQYVSVVPMHRMTHRKSPIHTIFLLNPARPPAFEPDPTNTPSSFLIEIYSINLAVNSRMLAQHISHLSIHHYLHPFCGSIPPRFTHFISLPFWISTNKRRTSTCPLLTLATV